jgi:hypothetical protein
MTLLKKILFVAAISAVATAGIKYYQPEKFDKYLSPFLTESQKVLGETHKKVKSALNKDLNIEDVEQVDTKAEKEIKPVIENEIVKETVTKIDKIVKEKINQEIGDVKKIPQEQIDRIKEEVKKEVKKQICS